MAAQQWPAYTVEKWPVDRLKPYKLNARTHGERQIGQLRASLREFGWTMPILAAKDGSVIAGHGRLEAAKAEGITEVPVIIAAGWSKAQQRAYRLADNKLAETSTWNTENLALELADLSSAGIDLKAFGFKPAPLTSVPDVGGNIEAAFQILIECADEAEQLKILERLQKDGITARALIA